MLHAISWNAYLITIVLVIVLYYGWWWFRYYPGRRGAGSANDRATGVPKDKPVMGSDQPPGDPASTDRKADG